MSTGDLPANSCGSGCTFAYHSVVPPTHCPKCGRCLGCGYGVSPYPPYPPSPFYPYPWPYTHYPVPYTQYPATITCGSTSAP